MQGCRAEADAKAIQELNKPLQEYEHLYKMYYARAEWYEGRFNLNRKKTPNDLTEDEFYTWSAKAANARRRYIAGELSADEFLRGIVLDEKDLRPDLDASERGDATI